MPELKQPENDGLITPDVGAWSRDKHHFLRRYMDAFTTAMKKKRWNGLHYIDLFAGAGIERIRDTEELDWGSALLAAKTPNPFTCLHLCELSDEKHSALTSRLQRFRQPSDPQVLKGDANERVEEIIDRIPQRALALAFLDPYGLHLDFTTVVALSRRRVDLVIYFPDHVDALRNWKMYEAKPNSNLDRFLGEGVDWLSVFKAANPDSRAEVFRNLYVQQLKRLGYKHFEPERILAKRHPVYLLVFASKSAVGRDIWRRVATMKPDQQRGFDFGDSGLTTGS